MGDSEESFGGEDMAILTLASCPRETVDEAEEDKGDEDKVDEEKESNNVDEYEELVGRYEYEIEEDVADFVDEECRERHSILESDDEGGEDEFVFKKSRMGKDDKLALGYSFYSGYQFKQAALEYALSEGMNIKQGRWEKTKLSFICGTSKKCKWRVYCSFDKRSRKWLVKTRYPSHSCTKNGKCLLLKGPAIANLFMDQLRLQPDCMPREIQRIIKDKLKIVSTRDQCQKGRLLALKMIEKEYEEQFAHLRGYAEEIMFQDTEILEAVCASGPDMISLTQPSQMTE